MNSTLYFYGGGDIAFTILNAVAAIFGSEILKNLINMATAASLAIISFYAVRDNKVSFYPNYLIRFALVSSLLTPVADITIYDKITKTRWQVSNIPIVISGAGTIISEIGNSLTEVFEMAMSLPGDLQYQNSGMIFGSRMLARGNDLVITDQRLKGNFQRFTHQCIALEGLVGKKFTIAELKETNDIWALISKNPSKVNGYLNEDNEGKRAFQTCYAGVNYFQNAWGEITSKSTKKLNQTLFGNTNASGMDNAIKSLITTNYSHMMNIQSSAEDLLRQQIIINEYDNAIANKLNETSSINSFALAKAQVQQNANSLLNFDTSSYNLPIMYTICKILLLSFSILIIIGCIFPGGESHITTYFKMLLCIELWPAAFAILNFIMTFSAQKMSGNSINLGESASIIKMHQNICNITSMLVCSIPMITWMLLNKSGGALLRMADSMNSGYMSTNTAAASEIASGNVSMGNISYRNEQIEHHSRHKFDNSMSVSNWRANTEMASGAHKTLLPNGNIIYGSGAGINRSKTSMDVQYQNAFGSAVNDNIAQETVNSEMYAKNIDNIKQNINQEIKDFGHEFSEGLNKLYSTSRNSDKDFAHNFSNLHSIAEHLSRSYNIDKDNALAITASATTGIGNKWLGINLGGNRSYSETERRAYNDAINLANNDDYRIDKSFSQKIHEAYNKDHNFAESRRHNESISNHISELTQTSYQEQNSLSKLEKLDKIKSLNDSQGISFSKEDNDGLIQFIAEKINPITGQRYGDTEAMDIIDGDYGKSQLYVREYMQQHFDNYLDKLPDFQEKNIEKLEFSNNLENKIKKEEEYNISNKFNVFDTDEKVKTVNKATKKVQEMDINEELDKFDAHKQAKQERITKNRKQRYAKW